MARIAIAANYFSHDDMTVFDRLREGGFEVTDLSGLGLSPASSEPEVIDALKGFDAALAGLERYTKPVLEALSANGLRMISRCGIGYDSIDTDACRECGVTLARAVGSVEGAVAEHVMAYILHFARRLDLQSALMHEGRWQTVRVPGAKTRTLGLVGFGGIGKEIAKRAAPFGMKIVYYCRHPQPEAEKAFGAEYRTLDELLSESDYVSANVPLTDATRGMFNAETFGKMKEGAVFINIARGPVADEAALAEALNSGHLAGAGVDVFSHEPCTDSPLRACPNAILTPHAACRTIENQIFNGQVAAGNAIDWLRGKLNPVCRVV